MKKIPPIGPIAYSNLVILGMAMAKHQGRSLASISRCALNDPPALERLKNGIGSVTFRVYDRAIKWFQANWPADLPWPAIQEPFAPLAIRTVTVIEPALRGRARFKG